MRQHGLIGKNDDILADEDRCGDEERETEWDVSYWVYIWLADWTGSDWRLPSDRRPGTTPLLPAGEDKYSGFACEVRSTRV